jgi:hypothetical protein
MSRLLAGLFLLVTGCDSVNGGQSDAADLMSRLDGTWTRTVAQERISPSGTVSAEGTPRTDAYEIGRVIRCNRTTIEAAGDADRIAVAFDPTAPDASRNCDVLTSDGDAQRIVLVGDQGSIVQDRAGTIVEDSGARQVWTFYAFDGADAVRTTWTLTR